MYSVTPCRWPSAFSPAVSSASSSIQASRAGEVLPRGTRAVGGQLQQLRRAGQRLLPVLRLRLQHLAVHPAPLPHRVVRVLDRQRGKRIRLALRGRRRRARPAHG